MNNKLTEQIKSMPGVKTITNIQELCENTYLVTFEPEQPVLHDEYGVPLFEDDKYCKVDRKSYKLVTINEIVRKCKSYGESFARFASKESAERWIEENKQKPVYIDDEGVEFFQGDECFYYSKESCFISNNKVDVINFESQQLERYSKIYKSRKDCEIALAKFILNKYNNLSIEYIHKNA